MRFFRILRSWKRRWSGYAPSIEVFISRKNLLHNLREYQTHYPKQAFAPVLKSNAYGHGLVEVAEILEKEKLPFLVVDSLYEARVLRSQGIKTKILVIGYVSPQNVRKSKLREVAFTIIGLEQLHAVVKLLRAPRIFHLKIDTGMHRQGILPSQIDEALKLINACKYFQFEGICSHFADADNLDESFTKLQVATWERVIKKFKQVFPNLKFFHLSASAGVEQTKKTFCNVVRLGVGLYGFNPSPSAKLDLRPVLAMQSVISSVRELTPGEQIGYGITYQTFKPTKVATVPVGYFEGVDRNFSNQGVFLVKDQECLIVGRVSMNITSVDVSGVPGVKLGDKVVVISNNQEDKNSVANMARLVKRIPYEILVHIPQHLRRTVS